MATVQRHDFGTLLRRFRIAAGLTQEELAERAKVSARTISDLERGISRAAHRGTVELLADALHLLPADRLMLEASATRHRGPRSSNGASLPTGAFLGALPEGPLIGRDEELACLEKVADAVVAGSGRFLLLDGEPGVGKTRLAQEAACRLLDQGFLVATGRCYQPEQSVPFYPFLEALTAVYSAAPPHLRGEAVRRWPHLALLVPDLALDSPPRRTGSRDEQQRLFRAVTSFLEAVAAGTPLTVLLDDLHWADESSLKLLMHLARYTRDRRILLLGTHRAIFLGTEHPLVQALTSLDHEGLVEHLSIQCLSQPETAALVLATLPHQQVPEEFLETIHRRTEGNPFFTRQLLRALQEREHDLQQDERCARQAVEELNVPRGIRAVIWQRLAHLEEATRETLREASVLGQVVVFEDLQALGDRTEDDLDLALEEAAAAGLVRLLAGPLPTRYAFDHTLTQQALYEDLSPRRRIRLHCARAEALERRGRKPHAAELAWHFRQAHEPRRALPYALRAGCVAEMVFAHSEAEWHFRIALELASEVEDRESEAEALVELGAVLKLAGRYDEALRLLDRATRAYAALGNAEGRARAVAQIGHTHFLRGTPDVGTAYIQPLLEDLEGAGSSEGLAALYAALAYLWHPLGNYENSFRAAERGSELARSIGNDVMLAHTEAMRGMSLSMLGRVEEGHRVLEETIPLAEAVRDLESLRTALTGVAGYYVFAGEFDRARRYYERMLEVVEGMGDPAWIAFTLGDLGWDTFYLGDWERACRYFDRAMSIHRSNPSYFLGYALWQRGLLLLGRGEWEEASQSLQECIATSESIGNIQVVRFAQQLLAERDLLEGHPEAARSRLNPLLDRPGLDEQSVTPLLSTLAWAHLEMGNDREAEEMLANAIKRAAAQGQRTTLVDALRVQGMLATRRHRWSEAERSLSEATSLAGRLPYPYAEARALYEMGRMYACRAVAGVAPETSTYAAREKLDEALKIFRRLGARHFVEHTEQALSELKTTSKG